MSALSLTLDTPTLAEFYESVSQDRQFKAGQFLLEKLRIRPGQAVLDIGAGTGLLAAYAGTLVGGAGSVVGIDPLPLRIEIAKRKIPGARYSLDELCKRFGVDLSARTKHGALLDAQLTAEIYLELIGGRQKGLMLAPAEIAAAETVETIRSARQRPQKLAPRITAAELEAHTAFVAAELGDKTLWNA